MIKGISRAGLGEIGDDEQFIALASQYGFKSVDLDAKGLINHFGGVAQTAEYLKQKDMIIGSFGLPVDWRSTDENFRSGLVSLIEEAATDAVLMYSLLLI
jgi:hypothetical protein